MSSERSPREGRTCRSEKAHRDVGVTFNSRGAIMGRKELTLNSSRGASEEQVSVNVKAFPALEGVPSEVHLPPGKQSALQTKHPCEDLTRGVRGTTVLHGQSLAWQRQ